MRGNRNTAPGAELYFCGYYYIPAILLTVSSDTRVDPPRTLALLRLSELQ